MVSRTAEKNLTPAQEKELVEMLEAKRLELTHKLKRRRTGASVDQQPGDEADLASEDVEVSLETRLMDRDAKLLREVERALEKVKNNCYGLCEGTDEPIGYARLKLRPWTRYSVTYKEELEREEKRQGGLD
ncbi:TraR/DksA family transcriptional regulator [Candidatus Dependentiae bacterium]|nr:TraR/DksA family transcriptional regulator [Candidatus Dependentiae bacterium]